MVISNTLLHCCQNSSGISTNSTVVCVSLPYVQNANTHQGGHLLIVSLLESSSSRNNPPDSWLWWNSKSSKSGSGCASGGFSSVTVLIRLLVSLVAFFKLLSTWMFGALGVINAATTEVEDCWGVELSQQEKGHGGGGAIISSERDCVGLRTENWRSGLRDMWVRFQGERAGGNQEGKPIRLGTRHKSVYWKVMQRFATVEQLNFHPLFHKHRLWQNHRWVSRLMLSQHEAVLVWTHDGPWWVWLRGDQSGVLYAKTSQICGCATYNHVVFGQALFFW